MVISSARFLYGQMVKMSMNEDVCVFYRLVSMGLVTPPLDNSIGA